MTTKTTRRDFLKRSGMTAAAVGITQSLAQPVAHAARRNFDISLAAWSLHRSIGEGANKIPMLDMPKVSSEEFGIQAIELVNQMMAASDASYVKNLGKNAAAHNVKIPLIMIDREGSVGSRSEAGRAKAVERHSYWIDIAAELGCHSVRMNWAGAPRDVLVDTAILDGFIATSVPGLRALCDYGDKKNINVIIENHGGPSSYPDAFLKLIKAVDHERFGTLPDFGNFPPEVDNYDAVDRLMPYAKAVSAKCYDFDDETGDETKLDFERLLKIVVDDHKYHGYIGVEYEGRRLSEFDGIKGCKKLLVKLRG